CSLVDFLSGFVLCFGHSLVGFGSGFVGLLVDLVLSCGLGIVDGLVGSLLSSSLGCGGSGIDGGFGSGGCILQHGGGSFSGGSSGSALLQVWRSEVHDILGDSLLGFVSSSGCCRRQVLDVVDQVGDGGVAGGYALQRLLIVLDEFLDGGTVSFCFIEFAGVDQCLIGGSQVCQCCGHLFGIFLLNGACGLSGQCVECGLGLRSKSCGVYLFRAVGCCR
ncbi:MAG TPA: hypothetical protein DHV83_01445, partial [Prevotella sp.]|nr:hypothetical protein [Prevotella sp.]